MNNTSRRPCNLFIFVLCTPFETIHTCIGAVNIIVTLSQRFVRVHIYMYLLWCVCGGEGGLTNGDFSHLTDGENTQHALHLSVDVTCRH